MAEQQFHARILAFIVAVFCYSIKEHLVHLTTCETGFNFVVALKAQQEV